MRSIWRTLDPATVRAIMLVCLADAIVGASFGAIAVSGGLDLWVPIAMSVLVFAGGAQFAAVGVLLAGGGAVAAVITGLVLNARHLPFGFAVADVLSGRWPKRLIGAHFVLDESVAFTMRQRTPRHRRAAFWICGVGIFVTWNAAVLLGALAGGMIDDTGALGLDAAFPTVLLALVLPSLADPAVRAAALIGAVIAVAATPHLPAGLPVLLSLAGLALAGRAILRRPVGPADDPEPGVPGDAPAPGTLREGAV